MRDNEIIFLTKMFLALEDEKDEMVDKSITYEELQGGYYDNVYDSATLEMNHIYDQLEDINSTGYLHYIIYKTTNWKHI